MGAPTETQTETPAQQSGAEGDVPDQRSYWSKGGSGGIRTLGPLRDARFQGGA